MRRFLPYMTLALGTFLLASAPLLHSYVPPRVELAPLDEDAVDVSTGTGVYLDPATGRLTGPALITVTRHTLGNVAEGLRSGFAVWDIATEVDTPTTLPLHDPRKALSFSVTRWVFDRHSNTGQACCGAHPVITAQAFMKYPFNLAKTDYTVWDGTAGASYQAHYTGTVTLQGHVFYRFTTQVPSIRIGSIPIPAALLGLPAATGTVNADEYYANSGEITLVDPVTGAPVSGSSHPRVTARRPGEATDRLTLLDVELTSTPDSTSSEVRAAETNADRLAFLSTTAPIAAAGLGLPVTAVGIASIVRRRSASRTGQGAS